MNETSPADVRGFPPPEESYKEQKERQSKRRVIRCLQCGTAERPVFHQLPKPAPERVKETKNETATKELSPFA